MAGSPPLRETYLLDSEIFNIGTKKVIPKVVRRLVNKLLNYMRFGFVEGY